MLRFHEAYQQGSYQEVYDELLAMGSQVSTDPALYEDALLVMRAMMKRVRVNIETLLPRLQASGYVFGAGLGREFASDEEKAESEREMPVFQPPQDNVQEQIALLQQHVTSLPLALQCFYEEVGCVNFVGAFPFMKHGDGCKLDPLFIFSLEIALQQVILLKDSWEKSKENPVLMLTGDNYHKYNFSGGGSYDIVLPCYAIDTLFVGEPHNTTFVNYLRTCMKWGALPGLEQEPMLSEGELKYLTADLLPF